MNEDPDSFNPEEDIRDYRQVVKSLPVFCVSSRAYQKLSGRLQKDSPVCGFTNLQETEMPQLQAHCRKLTERGRQASCRSFLYSIKRLLNSLALWASDDGTGSNLTSQQQDAEKAFLGRKLKELEKALGDVITDTLADVSGTLNEQLFDKFAAAIRAAGDEGPVIAAKWGEIRPVGLHYGTYKAVVRRNGVYQSTSAGPRDFNGELAEPVYKQLANAWEKSFQCRLPNIIQTFKRSATNTLRKFHAAVEQRTKDKGHGLARIGMLGNQLEAYSAIFGEMVVSATQMLNEGQREVNREFTPPSPKSWSPRTPCAQRSEAPGHTNE